MTSVREIFDTMEYGPAPEADAAARDWLSRHDARFGHYIGGGWTKPVAPFEVSNPATGKVIAHVSQGSKRRRARVKSEGMAGASDTHKESPGENEGQTGHHALEQNPIHAGQHPPHQRQASLGLPQE